MKLIPGALYKILDMEIFWSSGDRHDSQGSYLDQKSIVMLLQEANKNEQGSRVRVLSPKGIGWIIRERLYDV